MSKPKKSTRRPFKLKKRWQKAAEAQAQTQPQPAVRKVRKKSAPPPEESDKKKSLPPLPTFEPLEVGGSFTIPAEAAGHTVLAILRALRPGESWSKLRSVLLKAHVSLNGVVCIDEARRVVAGDELILADKPRAPLPQPSDVKIIFADPHIVVVEKPAGMMTHRRPEERNWSLERKARQPTLDEALNELLAQRIPPGTRSRTRLSLVRCVHRLDRDTSGVLVFARNEEAEAHLVSQFRKHTVHRVYWAIVHGRPQDGTIVTNLVRDRGDGRRGSVFNSKIGQRAVTHVRWMEQLGEYSQVECRLETGRTNQIRIHLAEKGCMVCGDIKYDQPFGAEKIKDISGAPRLALHAAELGFIHPVSGEELFFQMPFPADLDQLVKRLRKSGSVR